MSAFIQFSVTKMPKWSVYVCLIEGRKTGTSGVGCTADPLYPNINVLPIISDSRDQKHFMNKQEFLY